MHTTALTGRVDSNQRCSDMLKFGIGISPQYHRLVFELFERFSPDRDVIGAGLTLRQTPVLGQRRPGQTGKEWFT
jgi:light-regulated signal transduction histidine kinase (bacteriophytochrome)